jgi:hypothetical protein
MKAQFFAVIGSLVIGTVFAASTGKAASTDGLVALYPFSGDADDTSGNGHNGVVHGPTLTTDRFGNANSAYDFDGRDDYISVPYASAFNLSAFTICAWIRPSTDIGSLPSAYNAVIAARGEDAVTDNLWGSFDIHPQTSPAGTGVAFFYEDGADNERSYGTGVLPLSQEWMFVAITRSLAGELTIYADGDSIGHWDDTVAPSSTVTRELTIGARYYSAYSEPHQLAGFFPGSIDDVRLYDRPLSAEEIRDLSALRVPSPDALLLAGMGAGLVGYFRKRRGN